MNSSSTLEHIVASAEGVANPPVAILVGDVRLPASHAAMSKKQQPADSVPCAARLC